MLQQLQDDCAQCYLLQLRQSCLNKPFHSCHKYNCSSVKLFHFGKEIYLRAIAFFAAFMTSMVSILYFAISSSGVALSPNVSFTPTYSCGVGVFLLKT